MTTHAAPALLTTAQVAELLQCSVQRYYDMTPAAVRHAVERGQLVVCQEGLGCRVYIDRRASDARLRGGGR